MVTIDSRFRYLAKGQMWPAHWQDFRTVDGQISVQRFQLDFLGVSGIGKTYLTKKFAEAIGERVPQRGKDSPLSEEWAEAFGDIYDNHFALMASEGASWEDKHRRTVHLAHVIDLEQKIMRFHRNQIVINGVSVLRHRLSYFTKQAAIRPDFVSQLLAQRVVIHCTSVDPVSRAIEGKIRRRDKDLQTRDIHSAAARKVAKISEGVAVIKNLGVPVLDIDLDDPIPDNIAKIAVFMKDNGMESRGINRLSGRNASR